MAARGGGRGGPQGRGYRGDYPQTYMRGDGGGRGVRGHGARGGGRGPWMSVPSFHAGPSGFVAGFVWPPPETTQPSVVYPPPPVVFGAPMQAPPPAAYAPVVPVAFRAPFHAPRPSAYPPAAPVAFRTPTPSPPSAAHPPAPVVSREPRPEPSPAAHRPAPVVSREPRPEPSPAAHPPAPPVASRAPAAGSSSSAASTAALAKEVEQKLFVIEPAPPAPEEAGSQEAPDGVDEAPVAVAPVSKKGLAHPVRPGIGLAGRKVRIRANHFFVKVADNNLFHYDVAMHPESQSRATNRAVIKELVRVHGKTSLGGKMPAYDGRKSFYTAGSLPFESKEFVIKVIDEEKKGKESAEREYKITIRIAGRTDMYHLNQFLLGRQRDIPQETIQVLDVVLRESPSLNYVTVSRSFFSTNFGHRGDIGEGLECWRGYYQSLRPTQMGLSLNIDISATSFYKPVTVVQFVDEFLNIRDTSRPLSDRDRVKIKKALRGIRIETTHQQDKIMRYKIAGITPVPMSQLVYFFFLACCYVSNCLQALCFGKHLGWRFGHGFVYGCGSVGEGRNTREK